MLICLSPMDWITDSAYRTVAKQVFDRHNKDNQLFLFTEFMSADWFVHNPWWVNKHILKISEEHPVIAQIFWGNIDNLIHTAQSIEKYYPNFYWIELNIWCPSPKVMACWGWSGMMKDKDGTLDAIRLLSQSTKKPFSIKTRIWLGKEDRDEQMDFAIKASQYCHLVSIHGRTYQQWHGWSVDWNFIYDLKKHANPDTKIVGNGWIISYQDALGKVGNLDGVMIWQAAIGNPRTLVSTSPSLNELHETILFHLELNIATELYYHQEQSSGKNHLEEVSTTTLLQLTHKYENLSTEQRQSLKTPLEFRKHLFNYVKWLRGSKEFKVGLTTIREYNQLKDYINNFFLHELSGM